NIGITGPLLAWYAPVALLFALFTVSAAILQGINQQKFAVFSLSAGLLVKVLFNIQLIHTFGAKGAIFGTALAVGTAVVLNLWRVHASIDFSFKRTYKLSLLIGIFTIIMGLIIWILKILLGMCLDYVSSLFDVIIVLLIGVGEGGFVYLWIGYKFNLLDQVIGYRVRVLDSVLRKLRL